jgi:heat shock protein HslJ
MKHILMSICGALLVLANGCESNNGNSEDSGAKLAGTKWALSAWPETSLDPARFPITAAFDDTTISGTSAVNSYGGPYSAAASGAFSVGALQSTQMAGSEEAMRAEHTYLELLAQARKYTLSDKTLKFLDGDNNELLVFERR